MKLFLFALLSLPLSVLADGVADKALANARERAERTLKATGMMKIDSVFAISPVTFPGIEATIFGAQEWGEECQEGRCARNRCA